VTARTGRDLDLALGESRLTDDDADEMIRVVDETRALLTAPSSAETPAGPPRKPMQGFSHT